MNTASVQPQVGSCPLGQASLTDPNNIDRPRDFYLAMRTQDPVYFDPKLQMYLVSRYQDLQTVLRDPITYSSEKGYVEQYAKGFFDEFERILERDGGGFFPDAIMSDPPAHTRIRRLLDKAFTAHRVKALEPTITQLVIDMLDELAARGLADGVRDFAQPMTIKIICAQLGLQQFDADRISRWSSAVVAQIGRMQNREQMIENAREICALQNYLIARIRERQQTPGEDMISDLVHARTDDAEDSTLTFKEVVSLVRALLIAGNETTATALGNLMFLLATREDLLQQLQASIDDDRFMNRFVEELLRFAPPVRGLSRMTIREVELGGTRLPAGAHMLLLFASGNDDEAEFTCPREFDLNRPNLARHVAFGAGVHRCIGAALARMEIKVAAREIVRRLDNSAGGASAGRTVSANRGYALDRASATDVFAQAVNGTE